MEDSRTIEVPRFIYHHDGAFLQWAQPPISIRGFLQETLGRVAGTQVDNISCHMFTLGSAGPLYPSTIEAAQPVYPEMTETIHVWKGIRNLQAMVESGEDYWVPVVDATHGRRMRFWAAMRFNDGHPGTHGLRGRFVVDHPEYRIDQRCAWRCWIGRATSPSRSSSTPRASRCANTSCPWHREMTIPAPFTIRSFPNITDRERNLDLANRDPTLRA